MTTITSREHARRKSAQSRERQRKLDAEGRCVTCGVPRETHRAHRKHCTSCSASRYAREREKRLALIAEGRCERCEEPREPERKGNRRCAKCAAELRDMIARSRRKA